MAIFVPILVAFLGGCTGLVVTWLKVRGDVPDLRRAKAMNEVLADLDPSSPESEALTQARRIVVLRAATRFTRTGRTALWLGIGIPSALFVLGAIIASAYFIAPEVGPADAGESAWRALSVALALAVLTSLLQWTQALVLQVRERKHRSASQRATTTKRHR